MIRIFFTSTALWVLFCSGIKSPEFVIKSYPKIEDLTKNELIETWWTLDPVKDGVPGISLERAKDFLKNKTGKEVTVAIIGSGLDITHTDLEGIIWKNPDEIEDNGKDDDNNGYVDDIHGWNFLGSTVYENSEATRSIRRFKKKFRNLSIIDIPPDELDHYLAYKASQSIYENGLKQITEDTISIHSLKRIIRHSMKIINQEMGGYGSYTEKEFLNKNTPNLEFVINRQILLDVLKEAGIPSISKIDLLDYLFDTKSNNMKYLYNLNYYSERSKVKNVLPGSYGNNNVIGPDKSKTSTATYLSGLIANSGSKIPSIGQNVKIMPLRVLPHGDEYDEDVAFSIRYAVDNGAKVIVMYFSKPISPELSMVNDAIKYAQDKDVLIVMPSGNQNLNEDLSDYRSFPRDYDESGKEFVHNVIVVGSSGFLKNKLVEFSNYGANHIDVFAPGEVVFSLIEKNKYSLNNNSSLAATGITAGIAAVIRSYYPNLSAQNVKNIIMESGLKSDLEVPFPLKKLKIPFSKLSKSGKIANLYRALIFSEKESTNP